MRKAMDRQRRLDCPAVTEVTLNFDCRSEIIPILRALQHIYGQPRVRGSILRAIGRDVNREASAKRGRQGLDYWSILVLAAVRLGCNFDYDQLQDLAENHAKLRQIMGIGEWGEDPSFDWRRIRDNLCLLRLETLERINQAIAARKGAGYQERLKPAYRELLALAEMVFERAEKLRKKLQKRRSVDAQVLALENDLTVFIERTRHVCGTARRRVIEGEQVPNCDKLFSIFEPHAQLYMRGKAGQPMQFGRQVLVYEDAAGFVIDYHVLPRDRDDRDVIVERTRKLQKRLNDKIQRLSLDRGFHSPENQKALAEIIPHPCLPMPGANQSARQEEEASVEFRQSRQRHPGVESAIGALQSGNGLERCRDRTETGFSRYVGLGVLGRNLHALGKLLIAREAPHSKAAQSRRKKAA